MRSDTVSEPLNTAPQLTAGSANSTASAPFTLRNQRFEIGIAPAIGGSLTHFSEKVGETFRHWLRPAESADIDSGNVLGMAHFPLVPVSGRIARGVLRVNGHDYHLPLNDIDTQANYLHGEGWQTAWQVTHRTADSACLEFEGPVAGWPFRYHAWQYISIIPEGMKLGLKLMNTDTRRWPAGIGTHPWFAPPAAHMRAKVEQVWMIDAQLLFDRVEPVPERWDFTAGRPLAGSDLVNGFSGWDGQALLYWPGERRQLQIQASGALRQHLMVFTKHASGAVCVEPVSHVVDGFNLAAQQLRNDTGTVLLEPGETLAGEVTFTIVEQ